MIPAVDVHRHQSVVGNTQQHIFFLIRKLNDKQTDSVIGQRLPCFDVAQFRFAQGQIFYVGVRLDYPLNNLKRIRFVLVPPRREALLRDGLLTFPLSFLKYLGETKCSGLMSKLLGFNAGRPSIGFCICKKSRMVRTSVS